MTLHLTFLGGFQVTRDDHPLHGFISIKTKALLCYLVVERREHQRYELAALLWGEMSETKALTNLRQALANLRRLVGAHLIITRHTVTFDHCRDCRIDVAEFVVMAASFRRQRERAIGQRAAELYRGDFLDGMRVNGAPAFEEWVVVQRQWLHEKALRVFSDLFGLYYQEGDYAAALSYLDRLLALEPWQEEAHRQRMELLARLGRYSAALRQYDICRRVLHDELNVAPSAPTTALYDKIRHLQNQPPAQECGLPPQPTPFIGREQELEQLNAFLLHPDERLITILGLGGVGKTRLALEAARRSRRAFLDGVTFLALAPHPSPARLPRALADALGLPPHPSSATQTSILEHLQTQERLIILDNFEHLLSGSHREQAPVFNLLVAILEKAPSVKLLVTSRTALRLRWERRFFLRGLPCPPVGARPETAARYDSMRLFLRQARRLDPDFTPTAEDWQALVRICHLVEGLPLALELAAAWVGRASCASIAADFEQGLQRLTSEMFDAPARQRSLQAVFDHSWRLLSLPEQRVFRALAVFRGGFGLEAAAAVAAASPALLAALADKSLLRRVGDERYEMHEMLRVYAYEQLRQSGEGYEVHRRHLQYFVSFAQTAVPHLNGADQEQWLARLQREEANFRQALHFAQQNGAGEVGLRLATALWPFWDIRGEAAEGQRYLEAMLTEAGNVPPAVRAKALNGAGVLAWRHFDFAAAMAHLQASLVLLRTQGDDSGIARTLANLALIALDRGEPAAAMPLYRQSLAAFHRLNDTPNVALALNNMGVIALQSGDFVQARAFFEESLAFYRQLNQKRGISWALGNLGNVARQQEDYSAAIALYEEALALQRELGDRYAVALSLGNLGHALALQGDPARALHLYREAWEIFQEMEAVGDMAETLERMAAAYVALAQPKVGVQMLAAAATLRQQHHVPIPPRERRYQEETMAAVRAQLGVCFQALWEEGTRMAQEPSNLLLST